ncbi:MAG: hypothetical protein HeimC3_11810 [Candidatus Heimdallarchaeota archaeon LC_3]|nr:MAG: hypothetical protein HeimC3_11810 [Candidatus Heimdallarchaeota archaeon LC_3]
MSLVKELGNISIKAQDKLLVEHDPHNIPPLGVKVGFYKDVSNLNSKEERSSLPTDKNTKITFIGKIIDIIGPVKKPWIVVKVSDKDEIASYSEGEILFYLKESKKKGFKKKPRNYRKNR